MPDRSNSPLFQLNRWRFTLRTLLITCVVCSLLLAWLGNKLRDARQQAAIMQRASEQGFAAGFDKRMPVWWGRHFGWHGVFFWGHTGTVGPFDSRMMNNEALAVIDDLRYSGLSIYHAELTDVEICRWQPPAEMTELAMQLPGFSDQAAQHISQFKQLEELDLWGTSITSDGVAHLRQLPKLRSLILNQTAIDDTAVQHLSNMQSLRDLSIWKTNISAEGYERLRKSLPDCKIWR